MKPPERCPRHFATPSLHACNECREAYERARDFVAERDRQAREQRIEAHRQLTLAAAVCGLCDEQGRAPDGLPCSHDPQQADRIRQGVQACREALCLA